MMGEAVDPSAQDDYQTSLARLIRIRDTAMTGHAEAGKALRSILTTETDRSLVLARIRAALARSW